MDGRAREGAGWLLLAKERTRSLIGLLNQRKGHCHAPLSKIRENEVATKVGDVCTREKYPRTYAKVKVT